MILIYIHNPHTIISSASSWSRSSPDRSKKMKLKTNQKVLLNLFIVRIEISSEISNALDVNGMMFISIFHGKLLYHRHQHHQRSIDPRQAAPVNDIAEPIAAINVIITIHTRWLLSITISTSDKSSGCGWKREFRRNKLNRGDFYVFMRRDHLFSWIYYSTKQQNIIRILKFIPFLLAWAIKQKFELSIKMYLIFISNFCVLWIIFPSVTRTDRNSYWIHLKNMNKQRAGIKPSSSLRPSTIYTLPRDLIIVGCRATDRLSEQTCP